MKGSTLCSHLQTWRHPIPLVNPLSCVCSLHPHDLLVEDLTTPGTHHPHGHFVSFTWSYTYTPSHVCFSLVYQVATLTTLRWVSSMLSTRVPMSPFWHKIQNIFLTEELNPVQTVSAVFTVARPGSANAKLGGLGGARRAASITGFHWFSGGL